MPYQISISENNEYVIVKHEGKHSIDELEEARDKIKTVLLEKGLKKLLVDVSEVSSVLSRTEQICFTGSHDFSFPDNIMIAVVVPKKRYEYDKYIEDAAVSFDINQKLFIDIEEAKEWLTKDT